MDWFILSEKTFTATIIFYAIATAAYIVYLGWPQKRIGQLATIMVLLGVVVQGLGLTFRWIEAGIDHPPFTNMYESLLFFSWGMALFYIIIEIKYKLRIAGAFIFPLVLAAMGAAILNGNKEIQSLVPALQSHWLHVHVAVAALAYGAFLVSFGLSCMYLIKDNLSSQRIGLVMALSMLGLLLMVDNGGVLRGLFHLDRIFMQPDGSFRIMPGQSLAFPFVGRALAIAAAFYAAAAGLYIYLIRKPTPNEWPFMIMVVANLMVILGFAVLVIQAGNHADTALVANPFKLAILILVALAGSSWNVLESKFSSIRERLPESGMLDNLSYVSVMVAFPLMTLVIITGAVWAKYAWGRYWSWDPKETASLVTWLIYTLYLHARITAGWSGRRAAYIAIIGFISVIFTFLGVNILLPGLHSYGSM